MKQPGTPALLVLAAALGVFFGFVFHDPAGSGGFLLWSCPAALHFFSFLSRRKISFLCGFAFGLGFWLTTVWWVARVMRVHGGLSALTSFLVLLLMSSILAGFFGVFTLAISWMNGRSAWRGLWLAPFLWVALELARRHLPAVGFPWNLAGYASLNALGVMQLASLTGIYGVSFVVVSYSALLAWTAKRQASGRRALRGAIVAAGVMLPLAFQAANGLVPTERATYQAVLVQTNFPQSSRYPEDWLAQHAAELDELQHLSVAAARDSAGGLVIWPEVPAPLYLLDRVFASRAARLAAESRAHFLLGVIEWRRKSATEFEGFNSAVMLDPDGVRSFEYDKVHLVPFGEYVPLRRVLPMLESLVAEVGDFSAGTERNVGTLRLLSAGQRRPAATRKFGVFICYEAIFPDEVRQFTRNGAELLVNLSNDGWFGPTAARDQHLAMARVRAIENRRWLLRATNTGHTVAVDPYGRITARLAPDKRAALEAWFDFRADMTLYARWGDWFAWVCAGLSALMLALHWMESRRSAGAAAGG